MREILFRGKTDNKWVYGVPIYLRKEAYIVRDFCLGGSYTDDWVEAETIGQFTGLTDKNGKKIFEGDIVKIHRKYLNAGCEEDCLYEVIWNKNWCGWALRNLKPTQCCYLSDAKDGEIIGNKWDNPELLGE